MAGIACRTLIDITLDIVVVTIGVLTIVLMAVNAGKDGKIIRIRMAVAALVPLIAVSAAVNGEIRPVMVEGRIPIIGCMTCLAGGRETCSRMVGIGCPVVVGLVTGPAFS